MPSGGYSRPVPTSVGRTLRMFVYVMYVCECNCTNTSHTCTCHVLYTCIYLIQPIYIYVLFERWLIHLISVPSGGYSRPVPTSVGRTLLMFVYVMYVCECNCTYTSHTCTCHVLYTVHNYINYSLA